MEWPVYKIRGDMAIKVIKCLTDEDFGRRSRRYEYQWYNGEGELEARYNNLNKRKYEAKRQEALDSGDIEKIRKVHYELLQLSPVGYKCVIDEPIIRFYRWRAENLYKWPKQSVVRVSKLKVWAAYDGECLMISGIDPNWREKIFVPLDTRKYLKKLTGRNGYSGWDNEDAITMILPTTHGLNPRNSSMPFCISITLLNRMDVTQEPYWWVKIAKLGTTPNGSWEGDNVDAIRIPYHSVPEDDASMRSFKSNLESLIRKS